MATRTWRGLEATGHGSAMALDRWMRGYRGAAGATRAAQCWRSNRTGLQQRLECMCVCTSVEWFFACKNVAREEAAVHRGAWQDDGRGLHCRRLLTCLQHLTPPFDFVTPAFMDG